MNRSWDFGIDEERLDQHAAEVATSFTGRASGPVPLVDIAREEGLAVRFDDFGRLFDGRLEYEPRTGFILFVNRRGASGPLMPRERFALGHELGHFYRHREALLAGGKTHNSKVDFVSDRREEREADYFSASLMMPKGVVGPIVNEGPAEIARILAIATRFEASVTSAALRFVRLCHFPCAMVMSVGGQTLFSWRSEALRERGGGIGYIAKGAPVPTQSLTAKISGRAPKPVGEDKLASVWFDHSVDDEPWMLEEVVDLGDRTLTLISLEEDALGSRARTYGDGDDEDDDF
ncbi:MAG TPA: ImmA/IrrE family metallo-endopeptidase [Planctomycetota bacterium]|nr:ImmA/IrrE family metallo-endopeptidase [Planctomycetota bacterium]